jgi:hypothetical protein
MSDTIVRDGRRPPFLWIALDVVRTLREHVAEPAMHRTVLLALGELASEARDGQHAGFVTTRAAIAKAAGVSERSVFNVCADLERLKLLRIDREPGGASTYVLLDPTPARGAGVPADPGTQSAGGSGTQRAGVSRARVPGGKTEEEETTPLPPASGGNRKRQRGGHPLDGIRSVAPGPRWTAFVNRLEQLAGPDAYELYLDDLILVGLDAQDRAVIAGRCCWNPAHAAHVVARAATDADFEVRLATVAEAESVSGHHP